MKLHIWIILLALVPTSLLKSTESFNHEIYGLWYDHYSGIQLEIKHHRKGLKAREVHNYRKKKKWRTFYRMGRGIYDDCKGRVIIFQRRGEIQYRRSRGRTAYLTRDRGYGYDDYGYDRWDRWDDRYRYGRRTGSSFGRDRFCGEWHCADHNLYLEIEAYRDGLRARRRGGDWVYYDPYRDGQFRDRRGNIYYFDDGNLNWRSRDRKRKFTFKKR